ncbi:MAG: WHG domain-containing protein [Spirochaetales bacterium]|nr:WHG domain-containing protein [Leptospiraceae bacterium]MCP5482650.1 WHG domain-containing protein [Spirochaetales bacterium]MCP5485032.1 WHG domain-containing protein [Spirochaetales bacterium]
MKPYSAETKAAETPSASLRETLIEGGLRLLAKGAPGDLSLRQVAAAAGVTHAAAYRHFEDKNELLAAMAQEGFRRFYDYQMEALERSGPAVAARFRSLGWTYVRFALENPGFARIMFGGTGLDRRRYPGLMAVQARSARLLQQVIQEGQTAGLIAPGKLKQKTRAAWAIVHGMTMLLLDGQIPPGSSLAATERSVTAVIEHVVVGMAATAS